MERHFHDGDYQSETDACTDTGVSFFSFRVANSNKSRFSENFADKAIQQESLQSTAGTRPPVYNSDFSYIGRAKSRDCSGVLSKDKEIRRWRGSSDHKKGSKKTVFDMMKVLPGAKQK